MAQELPGKEELVLMCCPVVVSQLSGDAVGVLKDRDPFLGCSAVRLCRKSMD